jgi:hypothetical protein
MNTIFLSSKRTDSAMSPLVIPQCRIMVAKSSGSSQTQLYYAMNS